MSKYTFELREVISTFGKDEVKSWFMDYELSDYLTNDEINVINERGVWSKEQLADRIIDHYFLREVGTDSIGSFKLYLRDSLREIMESYAPIIYSASIKYDPLTNVDYSETYIATSGAKSKSSSTGSGSGLTVSSDTPQGRINKADILQGKYASSTGASENENKSDGTSESDGHEEYTRKMKGNSGALTTSQALIKQYRDVIRAVNTEIVYELAPLFMGIF